MSSTNILVLLATRFLPCKVIISERNYPKYSKNNRLIWDWLRRGLYRVADHLVVQTSEIENYFKSYCKSIKIIHNPVQVTYENLKEKPEIKLPSGKRLVAMGSLVPQKGFDLLMPVFANLHKTFNDWSLIILGSGPLETGLKQEAIRLGIEDFVYFPGSVMNPFSVLSRCDLFVLSSRYEGFPNALLEAMACGLPPVSFDCPSGPGEIIKPGVNGFLIPPGDVKAMEESLYVLMQDEGLRSNLGKEAIKVRERFAIDKIMKQWSRLIT
jgi:glycosyltransferase involved in cell wall biosynthesis